MLILKFDRQFMAGESDIKLKYKIVQDELDGVFMWAIEGLRRLRARGYFEETQSMAAEKAQYRMENNNVIIFVKECCVFGEHCSIEQDDLYRNYAEWCQISGYRSLSKIKFGKELVRQFPSIGKDRSPESRYWNGIALLKENDRRPY